jgi:hypothetical protein
LNRIRSKKVQLSYSELLKNDAGVVSYLYPLNTGEVLGAATQDGVNQSAGGVEFADQGTVFAVAQRRDPA